MAEQNYGKLNQLERTLPEGLLVDAGWMERHGYSTSLRSQYVSAGWLVQPVRGTYKRPLGELSWEKVVVSLQKLLGSDLVVGGRTALDLQGFSHYVSASGPSKYICTGRSSRPAGLTKLPLKVSVPVSTARRFLFKTLARQQTHCRTGRLARITGTVGLAPESFDARTRAARNARRIARPREFSSGRYAGRRAADIKPKTPPEPPCRLQEASRSSACFSGLLKGISHRG